MNIVTAACQALCLICVWHHLVACHKEAVAVLQLSNWPSWPMSVVGRIQAAPWPRNPEHLIDCSSTCWPDLCNSCPVDRRVGRPMSLIQVGDRLATPLSITSVFWNQIFVNVQYVLVSNQIDGDCKGSGSANEIWIWILVGLLNHIIGGNEPTTVARKQGYLNKKHIVAGGRGYIYIYIIYIYIYIYIIYIYIYIYIYLYIWSI